ncbi:hypothetical protein D3C81_843820 [compost metagenome]
MVNTTKHTKDGRRSHYQVEVGYNEIRIMQVDIQCRVTQEQSCQTTGDKERYQTDSKHHCWRKTDVTFP